MEGSQLKATLVLEGPFAGSNVETTKDLVAAEHRFAIDKYRWTKHTIYRETVDFEHIQVYIEDDDDDEEESYEDDDDDDHVPEGEDIEITKKRIQERRNRRAAARRRAQAVRRKKMQQENERRKQLAEKIKQEGEPHQKTVQAKAEGWYRACIAASFDRVSVVLDLF